MGESVYLCESIFMTFWVNTIHQCGEVRWFYNERGGPYECRKTHTYAVCMCVCVCHLTSSLSPPPCRVSSTLPLWQEVAAAAQRNKDTQQRQILSQHTVTSESLMKTCDRGRKGWNTERRGKSSLQIFTRFDLQLKWKLKISVDWTIKEEVCLKMTEQLHSAIVGCFFFQLNVFKMGHYMPNHPGFRTFPDHVMFFSKKEFISTVLLNSQDLVKYCHLHSTCCLLSESHPLSESLYS